MFIVTEYAALNLSKTKHAKHYDMTTPQDKTNRITVKPVLSGHSKKTKQLS